MQEAVAECDASIRLNPCFAEAQQDIARAVALGFDGGALESLIQELKKQR